MRSNLQTPTGTWSRSDINSMDSMEALDTLLDRMENTFEWGPDATTPSPSPALGGVKGSSVMVRPTMAPPAPAGSSINQRRGTVTADPDDVLAELEAFGSGRHPLNAPSSGSSVSRQSLAGPLPPSIGTSLTASPSNPRASTIMGGPATHNNYGSRVAGSQMRPMSTQVAAPPQNDSALDTVDALLAQIDAGLDGFGGGSADPLGQVFNQHSDSLFPGAGGRASTAIPQFGRPGTMTMAQPQMMQPQLIQPQMIQPQMVQPQLVQPQLVQPQMQHAQVSTPPAAAGNNVVMVPFPSRIQNSYDSNAESAEERIQAAARQLKPSDVDDDNLDYVLYQSATFNFKLSQDEFEMELYNELATVRKDPKFYAKLLYSTYRPYYQPDGVLRLPGMPGMRTMEGQKACEECIRFLASVEPITTEFKRNIGMCLAAKEAFDELAPQGSTEHPNTVDRLYKYGTLDEEAIDMCGYGGEDARQMMVLSWLICDGDPARTRREMIFNPKWSLIGLAGGSHNSVYRLMGVVVFASGFTADLEMMKLSPMFPDRVQSEVRPEVAELCDMFRQLQEGVDDTEEDNKTYLLRKAAVALSEATQQLVDSNQMNQKDRTEKKIVDAFEELIGTALMPDEDYLAQQAALRKAALSVGTSATNLTRNW